MAQTDAEYQCAWRERHRGKPRGNRVLLARLAALRGRVVQREAELAARPPAGSWAPSGRLGRRIWR
jgi:hypothetical protein